MPLPSNTNLSTLDYVYLGSPFVQVEAKSLDTKNLDIAYQGSPFVAEGPSGLNIFVKVSGNWIQANSAYVKVGGVWKEVTAIASKVSGSWKS